MGLFDHLGTGGRASLSDGQEESSDVAVSKKKRRKKRTLEEIRKEHVGNRSLFL